MLIRTLREVGATHFKSRDLEVTLSSQGVSVSSPPFSNPVTVHKSEPITENKEATEKIKELIETLKIPDDQLMDTIFPAGAGG